MLQTKKIEYHDGKITFKGHYVFDDAIIGKRPAVLVAHDWSGCNEFAINKAKKLAELGYVGFALDMYGDGRIGETKEEKMKLMQPLLDDRMLLSRHINVALETVKSLEVVDASCVGAIGFCFGGLCVLDLARSGADIAGIVSFHALLFPPAHQQLESIKAKILVLHGHDDPMVPVDQLNAFEKEMSSVRADWQINVYSNTMHAFTNPMANDPEFGTVYSAEADRRSWVAMKNFFSEVFNS